MDIAKLIQMIATGSAVALGVTYIVGGLIVNLNLARRGVVEFEILKSKYFVVGLVFLFHVIGVFVFACLPAIPLLRLAENLLAVQLINVVSMLAAGSLMVIWARLPSNSRSWLGNWWYWFAASAIGAVFPLLVLVRQVMALRTDIIWIIFSVQAVLTAALTFLAQAYHYSAFYYGRTQTLWVSLDPIGIGVPIRVRLACDEKMIPLFKGLGVASTNGVTDDLYLIDETSQHYIVGFHAEVGRGESTLKVDKSAIKAILYRPAAPERRKK